MKNSFKLLFIIVLSLALSNSISAQDNKSTDHGNALNVFVSFGHNTAISANYEINLSNDITFAPEAKIWFAGVNEIALGARADYYFDRIMNLSSSWDIWAGIDGSILIDGKSDFYLNLHAGVEYALSSKWGVIAEFGGGKATSGGIGIAFHL